MASQNLLELTLPQGPHVPADRHAAEPALSTIVIDDGIEGNDEEPKTLERRE